MLSHCLSFAFFPMRHLPQSFSWLYCVSCVFSPLKIFFFSLVLRNLFMVDVVSLYLLYLGFLEPFGSVGLEVLSNLENLWPLFLQTSSLSPVLYTDVKIPCILCCLTLSHNSLMPSYLFLFFFLTTFILSSFYCCVFKFNNICLQHHICASVIQCFLHLTHFSFYL